MNKPTPLTDQNYLSVLVVAAQNYLYSHRCICDKLGNSNETCFRCEVKAAIAKAEEGTLPCSQTTSTKQ